MPTVLLRVRTFNTVYTPRGGGGFLGADRKQNKIIFILVLELNICTDMSMQVFFMQNN